MKNLLITIGVLALSLNSINAQTWKTKTSGITDVLRSVHFPDNNTGYIVGNGVILKSTNSGQSWTNNIPSTYSTYSFWDVHFINSDTGFIVGESNPGMNPHGSGIILKTTNGGTTWTSVHFDLNVPVRDLFVLNKDTLFACGGAEQTSGKILRSTNGGNSWAALGISYPDGFLGGMHFTNSNKGFVGLYESGSGSYNPTSTTWLSLTNGGTSRASTVIPNSIAYWVFSTDFPTSSVGYSTSSTYNDDSVFIRKTIDGGSTWAQTALPSYIGSIYGVDFLDNTNGYIVGGKNIPSSTTEIMRTSNGGTSWISETTSVTNKILHSVFMINDTLGYAVGEGGTILKKGTSSVQYASITENNKFDDNSIHLYPNPTNSSTYLEFHSYVAETITVSIIDAKGAMVSLFYHQSKFGKNKIKLDTKNLNEGIYFVTIINNNFSSTRKIQIIE